MKIIDKKRGPGRPPGVSKNTCLNIRIESSLLNIIQKKKGYSKILREIIKENITRFK